VDRRDILNSDLFGEVTAEDSLKKILGKEDDKVEKNMFLTLLLTILLIMFMPLFFMADGFVLMTLWNWFVPLLGVSAISFPLSLGLYLLISFVFYKGDLYQRALPEEQEKRSKELKVNPFGVLKRKIYLRFVVWSSMLSLGWAIHLFV